MKEHSGIKTKTKYWWHDRPWRIVQTNMREIDMKDIKISQYLADLKSFNANTVIINTGGIVANYDTKYLFHTKNQYLTGDKLKDIIRACQNEGIRVFSRVDFSKVRTPVYEQHPDWAYVSPKGKIIDYHGYIHMCFNSRYQQVHAIEIMREIIRDLNPDGIFMNMGGYFVGYDYTHGWQGICQCENCQLRFHEMYDERLPLVEDEADPIFQKYLLFQEKTSTEYYDNIHRMFAEEKPDICLAPHADMHRREAGTFLVNTKQNYFYKASEIVRLGRTSRPDTVTSSTSVDFIDMMFRFSAVSPQQQSLRIAQSLANGGTADYYMCGRLDTHRDRSGYEELQRMFTYHKENEEEYCRLESTTEIGLIKPQVAVHNRLTMSNVDEYFGWYYLLSEQHYQFDCIEAGVLPDIDLGKYKLLILPEVRQLSESTAGLLDEFARKGGTLLGTGTTGFQDESNRRLTEPALKSFGIQRIGKIVDDILSAYFEFSSKDGFPRFESTDLVYLYERYIYAEYADGVRKYLRLIPPHMFAPPENAYHTNITDYPAFTINEYGNGRGVYVPWYPGDSFRAYGFPHMQNFMADLVENVLEIKPTETDVPPMVEITTSRKADDSAHYVHLVNGTGYFNNSYFKPVELHDLHVAIPYDRAPSSVRSMVTGREQSFEFKDGRLVIALETVGDFEAIKIV